MTSVGDQVFKHMSLWEACPTQIRTPAIVFTHRLLCSQLALHEAPVQDQLAVHHLKDVRMSLKQRIRVDFLTTSGRLGCSTLPAQH